MVGAGGPDVVAVVVGREDSPVTRPGGGAGGEEEHVLPLELPRGLVLEDLVDVKGWKALGNRLSEYKVTKVTLVQDDEPGYEEPGEDQEEEVAESQKDSQSPKKKISPFVRQEPEPQVGEAGQAILFAEPERPKHQVHPRPAPQRKIKVEQQDLFGQGAPGQESSGSQKGESDQKSEEKAVSADENSPVLGNSGPKGSDEPPDDDGKSFNVGETIEFKL